MKFLNSFIFILALIVALFISPTLTFSRNQPSNWRIADSAVPSKTLAFQEIFHAAYQFDNQVEHSRRPAKDEELTKELSCIEKEYDKTKDSRETFARLLRIIKMKQILHEKKFRKRILNDLAMSTARLKLYPLAMQCYFQAAIADGDSLQHSNLKTGREWPFGENDQFLLSVKVTGTEGNKPSSGPEPISVTDIIEAFEDNKPAFAYGLILHVKQPRAGKRKPFAGLNDVGHMFITLIKFNEDKSSVSRSFGFYPEKNSSFEATPIYPRSSSVFKKDSLHAWDEMVGKYISKKRFDKILRLLEKYEHKAYHLNENNCTDFGLTVADIGGLVISQTKGKWPLGKGNNPANTGQSILENKVFNTDTSSRDELFICNDINLDSYFR